MCGRFYIDDETAREIEKIAKKFYEWKKINVKQKEKYDFFSQGEPLFLAGIYHKIRMETGSRY